ncbi:MAG: energy transducer TonB [Terracidiphilus sp.]|jgi:TonB family protein
MRNLSLIALFVLSVTGISAGRQASPSMPAPSADAKPERVKVYAVGPGVTAPELLPLDLGPFPTEKCRKKMDGKVVFSLLVDTAGKPRNIMFIQPLYTDLDKLAQDIVDGDRFNPGTHDGALVVVAQSVEVNLKACVEEIKDDTVKKKYRLQLRFQPEQKFGTIPQPPEESILLLGTEFLKNSGGSASGIYRVGGSVTAPVPLSYPEAEFSDEARRAKYSGICLISLIVDTQGMPQNVHVERALGMGLDEKAIEAVRQYRFRPAMKNGVPVPVEIKVEVNFRLYHY